MIPDVYLSKSQDEDPASDTVFSSLETPFNLDYNFDSLFDVRVTQEESRVKLRSLPEYQSAQWLLFPDDLGKQAWDTVVLM